MANQHKVTIYLQPRRSSINVRVRGTGKIFGINLAGFSLPIGNVPLPTFATKKLYMEAIMNIVLDALEASIIV